MEALWREAGSRRGESAAHLWVTVLALLYGTGLRRGELERLDLEHFERSQGTLRIDGRKTGAERCVPLPPMVLQCLEAYLPQRHNVLEHNAAVGEQALLVTRLGTRLSGETISNTIHRIARRAGVSIHSLHQFRHTCASDLLEAGVHLSQVQRVLGHAMIATTVRYVHIADPQRRKAIQLHLAAAIVREPLHRVRNASGPEGLFDTLHHQIADHLAGHAASAGAPGHDLLLDMIAFEAPRASFTGRPLDRAALISAKRFTRPGNRHGSVRQFTAIRR